MKNVFVITDPGLDPDDIVNAWLLATAHKRGEINLLGTIANYSPSVMRARLLKGVFNSLGVDVPVRAGTNCNSEHTPRGYEFDFPLAEETDVKGLSGIFLKNVLIDSEDESITLLLISGLTDIAEAIHDYPELLKQKLKEVYVMGGANWENGKLIADPTASNNKFDKTLDSQVVYDFFVNNGIPLKVLTRFAAYAASVTPDFYENLNSINKVGNYLYKIQRKSIEGLWHTVNSNPPEHRLNREWFCKTFCKVDSLPIGSDESPWEYVKSLSLYDPLTSVFMLMPHLFHPSSQSINGVEHQIVGHSANLHGVVDKVLILEELKSYLV